MSTTVKTGVMNDDTGIMVTVLNIMPPYRKGVVEYCEELIVNTDFTSGEDLIFEFEGHTKILHAVFTTHQGAIVQYTEAAIGGTKVGQKLTLTAPTTNIKARIVAEV